MNHIQDSIQELDSVGFTVLPQVISEADCHALGETMLSLLNQGNSAIASAGRIVGGRNLLEQWDGWRDIVTLPLVSQFVGEVVGSEAGIVRILYFDKPPGKGWSLAVHKDRTIAVSEHAACIEPFSKPTCKAGVPHVEATDELLQTMLTLRLHLDPMHEKNGPLVVYPGSHHAESVNTQSQSSELTTVLCNAGDIFAMRPLLSHGSRAADPDVTDHRRVIHMELAPSAELPGLCTWRNFTPLFDKC